MPPTACLRFSGASRFFFVATTFSTVVLSANLYFWLGLFGLPLAPLLAGILACLVTAIFATRQTLRFLSIVGILVLIEGLSLLVVKLIFPDADHTEKGINGFAHFAFLALCLLFAYVVQILRFWSLPDLWYLARCELVALLALPFACWIFDSLGWLALFALFELMAFHKILSVGSIWGAVWIAVVFIFIFRRFRESSRKVDRFWLVVWSLVVLPFWILFWASMAGSLVAPYLPTRPLPQTAAWTVIEKKVFDILVEQTGKIPTATSSFDELGVDDLDEVEIRMALEEEFSVELNDDESIKSVPDAVLAIYNQSLPKGEKPWRDYQFKIWILGLTTVAFLAAGSLACWWLEKLLARLLPRQSIPLEVVG